MEKTKLVEETDSQFSGPDWEPETPFLNESSFIGQEEEITSIEESLSPWYELESPFVSEYKLEELEGITDPIAEEFIDLLSEIYDEEFDEAIFELVNEASDVLEERLVINEGDKSVRILESEKLLEEYFKPLIEESENLIENIAKALESQELSSMTEAEIEAFFDQFEPNDTKLPPSFEFFFKKFWKKAKKFGKKLWRRARKGIRTVYKFARRFTPSYMIFRKLKRLVRPLLKRVLKYAINRLPVSLQPLARSLARRFLRELEEDEKVETEELATQDLGWIQHEFDVQIANLLFAKDEAEEDVSIAEYIKENETHVNYTLGELEQARNEFISKISQLKEKEDTTELIENFIPIVMSALRIGIKIIGRRKVVNYLSKLLARLIRRFVGRENATILSRAIVDAGLQMVGLEVSSDEEADLAGNAIAATIEETIRRVATLPEYILDDEELLEGYVIEAFESAAASNFPPDLLKPELRETSDVKGTWVKLPIKGEKYYKKYTHIFEVNITPQIANSLKTFGGISLSDFLQNHLGLSLKNNIKAKVHLYESLPGTWISRITKYEKNVPGLGTSNREAWSQLHPLTTQAAGVLLGQPRLGRDVSSRFLLNRHRITIGQRFYYLEIIGMRMPVHHTTAIPKTIRRVSEVNLTLNFSRNQILVFIFISEAQAQEISSKLRQKAPIGIIISLVRSIYEGTLNSLRTGNIHRHVKIVHESVAPEDSIVPVAKVALHYISLKVLDKLVDKLLEWIIRKLSEYFRNRSKEFITATENPAYGVTLVITFTNPPGFSIIKKILKREYVKLIGSWFPAGIPTANIKIVPGFSNE